jgi:predicted DNA-binding transcriptional regulator AlpA
LFLVKTRTSQTRKAVTTNSQTILRPPKAASYLGLATSTLAKQRLRGDGPKFVRLSPRAIGYLQADLDEWLAGKRCSSTSEYRSLPVSSDA